MAKIKTVIGYATSVEIRPSVYEEQITEKTYYGEVLRNNRRLQSSDSINDDVTISNEISIVADPFMNHNIYAMRYLTYQGVKWKITNVDVQYYPRLNLSLGGIYNE